MGVRIPKFWLALVVFHGLGFFKDATSLTLAKRISSQQELTPEQKTQLLSMAGDKEDTVLSNLGTIMNGSRFLMRSQIITDMNDHLDYQQVLRWA